MGFSPFATPKIFFKKSGCVTFVPLQCSNFMQKSEKTNEQSLRYLDRATDGLIRVITKDPLGRTQGPKLENGVFYKKNISMCKTDYAEACAKLHHLPLPRDRVKVPITGTSALSRGMSKFRTVWKI